MTCQAKEKFQGPRGEAPREMERVAETAAEVETGIQCGDRGVFPFTSGDLDDLVDKM
jgi:hypothetical protein